MYIYKEIDFFIEDVIQFCVNKMTNRENKNIQTNTDKKVLNN